MDESQLEAEALAQIDEEQIRQDIITDTGFDPVDDAEKIEKLTQREVKSRTIASKAIGSKIQAKKDLEALKTTIPPAKKENNVPPEDLDTKIEAKANALLEKRDLDSLDLPDELKAEIQKVAHTQGVSIKKALTDPYIQFKTEKHEKDKKAEEAAISRTNKSAGSKKFDFDNPPEFDMSTPEGRNEWDAWKKEAIAKGY